MFLYLGLHIKFLTTVILTESLDVLTEVMNHNVNGIDVPVFLEVNIVAASLDSTQPIVKEPEKVIKRISEVHKR